VLLADQDATITNILHKPLSSACYFLNERQPIYSRITAVYEWRRAKTGGSIVSMNRGL